MLMPTMSSTFQTCTGLDDVLGISLCLVSLCLIVLFGFSQNIYFEVLYLDRFFFFFCSNSEEVGRKDVACHVYGTTIPTFQNKIEVSTPSESYFIFNEDPKLYV